MVGSLVLLVEFSPFWLFSLSIDRINLALALRALSKGRSVQRTFTLCAQP